MHVYIHVSMYTHMPICVVCVYLLMCMYVRTPMHMYVCVCLHLCVLVHVCTSASVFLLVIRFWISSLRLISPTPIFFSASFCVFQFHVSQSARYLEKTPGLIFLEVTVFREGHIKSVTEK